MLVKVLLGVDSAFQVERIPSLTEEEIGSAMDSNERNT